MYDSVAGIWRRSGADMPASRRSFTVAEVGGTDEGSARPPGLWCRTCYSSRGRHGRRWWRRLGGWATASGAGRATTAIDGVTVQSDFELFSLCLFIRSQVVSRSWHYLIGRFLCSSDITLLRWRADSCRNASALQFVLNLVSLLCSCR